jgi:hypothetical protein
MRTTVDIDAPILRDLKRLQKQERKSLGRLISELLAQALGKRNAGAQKPASFEWISRPMGARLDLGDKEAVMAAMEQHVPAAASLRPRR